MIFGFLTLSPVSVIQACCMYNWKCTLVEYVRVTYELKQPLGIHRFGSTSGQASENKYAINYFLAQTSNSKTYSKFSKFDTKKLKQQD